MQPFQRDPFGVVSVAMVDRFKKGFTDTAVEAVRPVKLAIKTSLFKAMWEKLDASDPCERVDTNVLMTYNIGGFRVGTPVLGSSKRRYKQIVRMKHVCFLPSLEAPTWCFVMCPSSKTTPSTQPVGHVLGAANLDGCSAECVDACLRDQCLLWKSDGASRNDVMFANPRTRKRYSRNVFTTRVKWLIGKVASRRVGGRLMPPTHRPCTSLA
jgi:hypothetical protein